MLRAILLNLDPPEPEPDTGYTLSVATPRMGLNDSAMRVRSNSSSDYHSRPPSLATYSLLESPTFSSPHFWDTDASAIGARVRTLPDSSNYPLGSW